MDAPYTVDNVRFALANSTVPGVPATSWEACLQEINELCGYKWYLKRQTNGATGGRVIFSKTFYCHRRGPYTPQRTVRLAQKESKKCGCTTTLKVMASASSPTVCAIKLQSDHVNHVPDHWDGVRTLPLTRQNVETIAQ